MKQRIAARMMAGENARGIASQKAQERLAASTLKAQERAASQRLRIGDRFVAQEHARSVVAEKQKLALAEALEGKKREMFSRTTREAATMGAAAAAVLARQVASAFSQAIDSAADKARTTGEKYAGTEGSLRELANLQGQPLGPAFLKDIARKNIRTGMTPAEGIAFDTQALNSGAQYIDTKEDPNRNMTAELSKEYFEKVATLATMRGLKPDVAGDMAGRVLGFRSYKQFGAKGPEVALQDVHQLMAILDAGVGQAPELIEQFNMLAATSLDATGANRGAFTNAADVATSISIGSQKVVGRSFTGTEAMLKQLRDFDNPLIQAAKITPQDLPEAALRKLAPVVMARAREFQVKPIDVLRKGGGAAGEQGFEDDLGAQQIETFISQGIEQGLYEKRRAVGAAAAAPGMTEAKIAAFKRTDEFLRREAAAEGELIDVERGAVTSKPDIIRMQATNELRRENKLDTTGSEFRKYLSGGLTFGMLPDLMRMDIDARAAEILNRRSPAGVPDLAFGGNPFTGIFTTEGKTAAMNEAIGRTEAAGGDPMRDWTAALDRNTSATEANNRLMSATGGGVPAAMSGSGLAPQRGPMR